MKKVFALLAVALASAVIAFAQAPAKDAKKPAATTAAPAKADAKVALMDINTASEKELATLPGIGDARAAAIVKGRPYKGKDDLVQKKVLTKKVYDDIKDKIIAKQQY
jgi:competence protein ComEA